MPSSLASEVGSWWVASERGDVGHRTGTGPNVDELAVMKSTLLDKRLGRLCKGEEEG